MTISANLGFPRIGAKRELKKALEKFWVGKSTEEDLLATAKSIRAQNWRFQAEAGLDHVPSNDFSLYDHVLDTAVMVGAIPIRYSLVSDVTDVSTTFAMARGSRTAQGSGMPGVPAMEMTKWFDTNYHYIVPEFQKKQEFHLASTKPVDEFLEAKASGIVSRPVLLGPISFLLLGKMAEGGDDPPLSLIDRLLPIYASVINRLEQAGATWLQMDEPVLATDLPDGTEKVFARTYERLSEQIGEIRLLMASYFAGLGDNLSLALNLPVHALHLDLVRAPYELDLAIRNAPPSLSLSLGVVDGRNIWKTDLSKALALIEKTADRLTPDRILIASACSLLHCPIDLDLETGIDDGVKSWLAFAKQKIREIVLLKRALNEGEKAVRDEFEDNRLAQKKRRESERVHIKEVKERSQASLAMNTARQGSFNERKKAQAASLRLPILPTTTIGSFPQTPEVRKARAAYRKGKTSKADYETFLEQQIKEIIRFQEELGIEVLVHGEPERSDMVEYFADQLDGFQITEHGWVQSYGSRCARPPIIFGDVKRSRPMTVRWSSFAQSCTPRPVKAMLTGPVTMLQWSFVRDDQSREDTCRQIALAVQDEVVDLEREGLRVIQIDEPALREGLPLHRKDRPSYLKWAVESFRLACRAAGNSTQIQTHMCYSEFNDMMDAIAGLDADVILIEASRSGMELLDVFVKSRYPNEIGPGIYDVHSERVPPVDELESLLVKALEVLKPSQVWVNPDCGLKTRRWEEARPALANLVEAARRVRSKIS
ncbi:5-methyltetrahydropteroyltriglutamate--homocysteine S-methyltransferase [Acidobacteriota bacterium]